MSDRPGQGRARDTEQLPGQLFPVPETVFDDPEAEHRWRARVRAARMSVPRSARDRPERSVYRSNQTGPSEIYLWDRDTDTHRQVTDRPGGTVDAAVSTDGSAVWWFADGNGDEFGHWMSEPFEQDGAAPRAAIPGLADGYSSGLALGEHVVVVGLAGQDGATAWISRGGRAPEVIYHHAEDALVKALSRDETLLAINHSEHGDSRNPGIRVVRTDDGTTVAERRDPDQQLIPIEFSPLPGDNRLLLTHERRGRGELLVWDPVTGQDRALDIDIPGELTGRWFPDAGAVLVRQTRAGRNTLHRYDLTTAELVALPTATGSIDEALLRPDTAIEYSWSNAAEPWQIRRLDPDDTDHALLQPGTPAPSSVALGEQWIDGPGGPIHVFITEPESPGEPGDRPRPAVFRVHGGPHMADEDSYNSMRAAWIDAGFTVVQVNYRGSSGYGAAWRNAIAESPGLTELADIAAVRTWCIDNAVIDPTRCLIEGYSWGGYLALLAAGTQPADWTAAIAGLPVADFVAAYAEEMEPLKAMDRALFGGSPADRPDAYRRASPITYAEHVTAPVLVMTSRNDPRCPPEQINNYLRVLDERGHPASVVRYESGHGAHVAQTVEDLTGSAISFARSTLQL